jgi:DNA segregation ATPase FtsK/SpoIIIE, S-DNA-T family
MSRKKKFERHTSKHRHYHRKQDVYSNLKLKKETINTVGAIWLWIFAGIITASFFSGGTVLSLIREELRLAVGWGLFTLPPILVSLSFLFFNSKSTFTKPFVPAGLVFIDIALIGLTRAGVFGDYIWTSISTMIGLEGSLLLFIGLFVIGLIILFNTSLDRFVDFLFAGFVKIVEWFGSLVTGKKSEIEEIDSDGFKIKQDGKYPLLKDQKMQSKEPIKTPTYAHPIDNTLIKKVKTSTKSTLTISSPSDIKGDMSLWEYPPLDLLGDGPKKKADRGDMRKNAQIIEQTLDGFGIQAKVVEVNPGPAVTQYALQIALGTKVSKITSLSSDMALALAAPTGQVRIEAPIPGRNLVGIEIPNRGLEFVTLKRMLSDDTIQSNKSPLFVPLGLDVSGSAVAADIHKMPHVLIAGSTGSGKSVLVNSWITAILMRTNPQQVRMIMVDPKRVELTGYNGVPHLLAPVIVESDKILSSLRWAIKEMEGRYKQFADVGVRNIESFNEQSGFQSMPYIIIVIDELADLMMYAPVEVEDAICRLAQMARATGIHLVLATQRPSVDVLTGLIKANVPTRIAFNVTSMVDSRVIIDMPGAERLLGRGDMLFIPPDQAKPTRIQGAFVSEKEVARVVEFLKARQPDMQYTEEVLTQPTHVGNKRGSASSTGSDGKDSNFDEALRIVCQYDKASASLLQRKLSVGYARAAKILDQLEETGIIGPAEGSKPRDVLMKNAEEYFAERDQKQEEGVNEEV